MNIKITHPEVEEIINQRLRSGAFRNAEDVILAALRTAQQPVQAELATKPVEAERNPRAEAIERLRTYGKTHGLSLDETTLSQLRHDARP